MSDCVPKCIEMLKIQNGNSEQNQMTITIYSDFRMNPVIYRDARNLKQKFLANSNDNNFLVGCPIESRNISRYSKLKTDARIKFKRQ